MEVGVGNWLAEYEMTEGMVEFVTFGVAEEGDGDRKVVVVGPRFSEVIGGTPGGFREMGEGSSGPVMLVVEVKAEIVVVVVVAVEVVSPLQIELHCYKSLAGVSKLEGYEKLPSNTNLSKVIDLSCRQLRTHPGV